MNYKVLFVGNDPHVNLPASWLLRRRGCHVTQATTEAEAATHITAEAPDLVVFNVPGRGEDVIRAVELLQDLRCNVGVVVLSEVDDDLLKVRLLDLGADDYIVKPVSIKELAARLGAILRRTPRRLLAPSPPVRAAGGVEIDLSGSIVRRNGLEVSLSRTEYGVLAALARRLGETVHHHEIFSAVWGADYRAHAGSLRTIVKLLRKKLGDNGAHPAVILTRPGAGYLLARGVDSRQMPALEEDQGYR